MVFHKMDTEEVSDRFVAPCFVNGLEAYDGEINLGVEENMISNEFAVKLYLEHEVKIRNKVVKKELIVALRGEIYFAKFIINPEEDDVEPRVIFGRLFLRMTKAITNFGAGTVTIYPEFDLFLEDIKEEEKSMDDWDQLLDFNFDDIPLLGGEELLPFVCKIGKSSRNKKRTMENLNLFYQDIGPSSSKEVRPVIEIMAYRDTYKKVLDEILKDKVELDGMIMKEEEEEAIKKKGKVNKNALADTGSDINTMPYRIYEQLRREEMKNVDKGIIMINHTHAEAMGILTNVLCQVGVTTLIAKFLILDIPIDRDAPIVVGHGFLYTIGGIRTAKSDSYNEEEYEIKRNKFGAPMYGPKPVPYKNCNDPTERSLALQIVINPFRKISVWKKVVSFLGSLLVPLKQVNWKPDYKGCYTKKEEATGQWRTEIWLIDPYGNIYLQGFTTKKTDRKLSKYHKLWEETMMRPDHQDPNALDNTKQWQKCCFHKFTMSFCYRKVIVARRRCDGEINDMLRIKLREAGTNEEIFTSVAWIRAFNINEPIYSKLFHDFYSTNEFDEVCADDELQTKKIIKFRLGGRAYSLSLLEFARRLGLYHAEELDEKGFDVYFQGGLRSDEHFNAQESVEKRT
ncbi:ribonuclease H-like domain-containing protein [Tanacetum coccineum]